MSRGTMYMAISALLDFHRYLNSFDGASTIGALLGTPMASDGRHRYVRCGRKPGDVFALAMAGFDYALGRACSFH